MPGHKTIVRALIALLWFSTPAMAQASLEADMRAAAGAYERKDMPTAVRLWKVWAGKGNAEARTLLGAMYWSGEGVLAQRVLPYSFEAKNQERLDQAKKDLAALAKRMTPAQIAEAERRVKGWKPSP